MRLRDTSDLSVIPLKSSSWTPSKTVSETLRYITGVSYFVHRLKKEGKSKKEKLVRGLYH